MSIHKPLGILGVSGLGCPHLCHHRRTQTEGGNMPIELLIGLGFALAFAAGLITAEARKTDRVEAEINAYRRSQERLRRVLGS